MTTNALGRKNLPSQLNSNLHSPSHSHLHADLSISSIEIACQVPLPRSSSHLVRYDAVRGHGEPV